MHIICYFKLISFIILISRAWELLAIYESFDR